MFVLGLGFMAFVGLLLFFLFRLSVQTPVCKFCVYNCVLGRNCYHMISGMLGVTNECKEQFFHVGYPVSK